MNNKKWANYYKVTKKIATSRKTLIKAIDLFDRDNNFEASKFAIDLGCGAGSDSLELLKYGWSVLAIDSQPSAISTLLSLCPQSLQDKIKTKIASFESLISLPISQLINASYSLPFMSPDYFYPFWEIILRALYPGRIFSGTFFGVNDSWHTRADMTFVNSEVLYNLFRTFEIEFFEEEEHDAADALGHVKHWHKYFVVAKKR